MSTMIEPQIDLPDHGDLTGASEPAPAQRLRATMAACRLQFTWFGTKKSLSAEQKALAAEPFDAQAPYLSAAKKLIDTKHPAFRAVTAVRSRATETWRAASLPFPEPGVRLIPHQEVESFDRAMAGYRTELDDAVLELDRVYAELRQAARERLGSLYNPEDYPESLLGLFAVAWDYPNVEPPAYLLGLNPSLYRQEQERVRGRFEEAVRLAEEAFTAEFARLVGHLAERLSGSDADGTPKVFRDSAVGNLREFFERFRALSVRSSPELDELVDRAQRIVRGLGPQDLRDRDSLREWVATRMTGVQAELDRLVVERPRRRILRGASAPGAA